MSDKILILITGANKGLGYLAAQQLSAMGKYHILVGSRDITKAEQAVQALTEDTTVEIDGKSLEPIEVDLSDDESIKAAVRTVGKNYGRLDVLLNNAGMATAQRPAADGSGPGIRELMRQHYDTNLFGTVAATEAFLPLLRKSTVEGGKRIAFTSSSMGSLSLASRKDSPMPANNFDVYRSTKSALNMLLLSYAASLDGEGFAISGACPGWCATEGFGGPKDPKDGAKELVKAVVEPKEKVHGVVVDENGTVPW